MKTRFKATNVYQFTFAAMILLGIGSLLQSWVIEIPPSRMLEVPFAVFTSLPAALMVSYVGAVDSRASSKLAARPLQLIQVGERLICLVCPVTFALILADWSPNDYLLIALRDFLGLWGIASISQLFLNLGASWFPSAALFFASITSGSTGQNVSWWAWVISPAVNLEAAWLALMLGALAMVGGNLRLSRPFVE